MREVPGRQDQETSASTKSSSSSSSSSRKHQAGSRSINQHQKQQQQQQQEASDRNKKKQHQPAAASTNMSTSLRSIAHQTRDIYPRLVECGATVWDGGPTFNQPWVNVSCQPCHHHRMRRVWHSRQDWCSEAMTWGDGVGGWWHGCLSLRSPVSPATIRAPAISGLTPGSRVLSGCQ